MERGDGARTDDAPLRSAAQSNVLAVVLLVGLVVVGALLVGAAGSTLLDGVQSESQEEVARDAAGTTHHAITEVLANGQSRKLPAADTTDVRVEGSGRLRVEMVDETSGSVCSRSLSVPLGAVVHEVGEGTVVYEGGAIWSVGDGGVPSVERPPPIAYDGERPRIAVQSVAAGRTAASSDPTIRANRSETREAARAADALLRTCPQRGHDDLRLTVTSPYAAGWERALDERLQGEGVRIDRNGSTVRALLPDATDGGSASGARVTNVRLPDRTITPEEPLDVVVTVANHGSAASNGTLELALPGTPERATTEVDLAPGERATIPLRLENFQLNRRLDRGSVVEYEVTLDPDGNVDDGDGSPGRGGAGPPGDGGDGPPGDGGDGSPGDGGDGATGDAANSTVTGSFVYAEETADLHLRGARPVGGDGRGLGVRATLRNLGDRNGTTDVRLAFENASLADADVDVPDVLVPGGRRTAVTIPVDAGALPPGEHDYRIEAAGETVRGTLVVRPGDDREGTSVGDLRVASIDPVASAVAPGEPFAADVTLENPGRATASGTVGLDVAGFDAVDRTVAVEGRATETVRVEVPAGAVERLRTGELHEYGVRIDQDGATLRRNGTAYLGREGAAPRVTGVSHETESDGSDSDGADSGVVDADGTVSGGTDSDGTDARETLTIRAALANRGQSAASAPVQVRLRDAETGETVVSESSSSVGLPRGAATTVEASIPAARLSGTYEYEVAYGGDAANGTVELSGLDEREDGLASSVAGEGTVTVLGTEVSYERRVGGSSWEKYWAPVSVAVRAERGGESELEQLENPAASDAVDARNLNAPGTQTTPVSWRWEQSAGEEVHLTLRSRLWQRAIYGYERAGERTGDGPAYEDRTYRDFRPRDAAWRRPSVSVDASAGENPANVRVLRDGDRVPEVRRGYPDQRNVSQVLDHGAGHRIDPETGELDLGPNEAVFLFELTDDRSYSEGIWQAAKSREGPGDPNFNDVVALVEFEANGTSASLDAALAVDDDARGLTVSLPDAGGGNGSVGGGAPDVETGPVDGTADPDPPTIDGTAGGDTRVEVDVGHVVVG